jgi:hypothetical protein
VARLKPQSGGRPLSRVSFMIFRVSALAAALAAGLAAAPALAATNLVANGGFETPSLQTGTFRLFDTGESGLTGWDVLGSEDNVALLDTAYAERNITFNAFAGENALDLSGGGQRGLDAGVAQWIDTVAGKRYTLSFWVGNADGSGNGNYAGASIVDLAIDGGARRSFANSDVTFHGVNWKQVTTSFTAGGERTRIAFFNGTTADAFSGLDGVRVIEGVPEPAAWSLMITGFGFAGVALRRRVRGLRAGV